MRPALVRGQARAIDTRRGRLRTVRHELANTAALVGRRASGRGTRGAIAPFAYGVRDERARAHRAVEDTQRNDEAAAVFGAESAFDPAATRAASARFEAPVLLLAGEVDVSGPPRMMGEFAALFPHAELVVQAGAGHFPRLDDADRFARTTATLPG